MHSLIGLALLVWTVAEPPRALEELRGEAEAAFHAGVRQSADNPGDARLCFACAAALYDKLRQSGAANPELYANLGNASLLAIEPDDPANDGLAQAILAYRRGLRLAPDDRRLQQYLAYARQQVSRPPAGTLGQPPIEHRPPWLPRWPGLLIAIVFAAYSIGCLALARWWMVRRSGWLTTAGVALGIMLLFLAGFLLEAWQVRQDQQHPLVVVARDGLLLRAGNGTRYPARYDVPLNRGVEGTLRGQRGRWLQIELAGGELGWVPRDAVLVDD